MYCLRRIQVYPHRNPFDACDLRTEIKSRFHHKVLFKCYPCSNVQLHIGPPVLCHDKLKQFIVFILNFHYCIYEIGALKTIDDETEIGALKMIDDETEIGDALFNFYCLVLD